MSIVEDLERKLDQLLKKPDNPLLFNQIGTILYQVGDPKSAAIYFQKAYQLNSKNQDIRYNYAFILEKQAQWQKAIPIYLAYLKLDPEDKGVIQRIGDCYYQLGKYQQAAEMYQQLQKI